MSFLRTASIRYKVAALSRINHRFKASRANDGSTTAASTAESVGKSLVAAVLSITTISIIAAMVECMSDSPPYDPPGQRFDQSEYQGRFARMLLACDPRLLTYTQRQVLDAKEMLSNYQNVTDNRSLWEARRLVDSAIHPDTDEFLPRPFRMSGYCSFNAPICVGMIASSATAPLLVWSWMNQSHNALLNYYNRNASSEMTTETMAKSYVTAVGSCLVVAFGLASLIQKRYPPSQAKTLLRWIAFPSGVVASSLNCYIVRSPEIQTVRCKVFE
jgi:hypothetical protein